MQGVILDVDGTLVDSNEAHAQAWARVLTECGHPVTVERIRPLIGMGGDKLLPAASGLSKDSPEGQEISRRRGQLFKDEYLPHLKPCPGASALIARMRQEGLKLVVASSAEPDELEALLRVVGATDLVEDATTAGDVKHSKPSPDVVSAALARLDLPAREVVMIGDTPYDVEAAERAGVRTVGVRCGGWSAEALAGAIAVYADPADLLVHYDSSPLAPCPVESGPKGQGA